MTLYFEAMMTFFDGAGVYQQIFDRQSLHLRFQGILFLIISFFLLFRRFGLFGRLPCLSGLLLPRRHCCDN
jgi:hypothetical protein